MVINKTEYRSLLVEKLKNIKLQPVPPLMPSESLSVRLTGINSAFNGINGVTGCNFIFFLGSNTITSTNLSFVLRILFI